MIRFASGRRAARNAGLVLSMLALLAGSASKAEAQCQLLAAPAKFDPPSSGLPSYFQFQARPGALSVGGTAGAYRLAVRYNYGFLVYSLASPGAPARTSIEDLLGQDKYPKNGDGQERVGPVTLSADGTRALQPWTDTVGYGTIAMTYSGTSFLSGGDFLPQGADVRGVAIVKAGTRYLGFSIAASGIHAADITEYQSDVGPTQKNGIYSELVPNVALGSPAGIAGVEAAGRSYVVAWSADTIAVIDVSNPGPAGSGLTASFTSRSYSASQIGIPATNFLSGVAAARHPSDGALHLLTEFGKYSGAYFASAGVTLNRVDPTTGDMTRVGTYQPPAGARYAQSQVVLLPFDTEVMAFFLEGTDAGGLKLEVHSSADFVRNLADSVPAFSSLTQAVSLAGIRASGGNAYLYILNASGTYAASVDCSTAPSPAQASLTAENVAYVGGAATAVADGGAVFIGDQVRVKPAFSPPDSVQPLLDWRLDYDFHDGNSLDSNATTFRLKQPDVAVTTGGPFPTQLMLIGPCDPARVPQGGPAPDPATGAGCWASVTTNESFAIPPATTPDFSPQTPADTQLTIGFEAQNALNAGSSSLAKHRITWKVPRQLLKSSSILSGGALEDGSEGSPLTTGLRWYFAQVPAGETGADVLTLEPGCAGLTCTPAFTQAGQTSPGLQRPGVYRYWVSVPYRGGFRTAECPGLQGDQVTCSGDGAKTVTVTDVVLSLTAPAQVLVGTPSITVSSTSKKATSVAACPLGTTGFAYNFCEVAGGECIAGAYSAVTTVSNPFPATGTGTISIIPTPPEGIRGLRIRYSYTTTGSCTAPTIAQWPATGWSPLTVLLATPTIRLRNSTDTADITKSLGIYWELTVGQSARAYAELNGVRDTNPPSDLAWSYKPLGSTQETSIGTIQGALFSISTAGDYKVVLRGYGPDAVEADLGVSVAGGGGGGTSGPPTVTSVTASSYTPSVGQTVSFSCNATQGGAPITSYDWVLDTGVTRTTSSASTSYAYTTSGAKAFQCVANDSASQSSSPRVNYLTVSGGTGSCDFVINNAQGARISYDSSTQRYDATSGQPLTFVASGVTTSVSWNFGNGQTGSGNPATYTYNVTQAAAYTVTLTSGTCSKSYGIDVSPAAGPSFTVADADTGTALASPSGVFEARAGQRLRFTATGTTGAVSWTFGDGETSTDASPVKTYGPLVDTTYVVTLTSNAQSKQSSIAVKGSTGAPLTGNYTFRYADGTTVNRSAVQPNKAITFTGADQATTYTWSFGDGSALQQGSPKDYAFTRGGTFTVSLTVARNGVPGTVTTPSPLSFVVLPPPDPLLWVAGGMAYASGSKGELFQSDLSIHNPASQTATVSLGYVAGAGWEGTSRVVWVPQALTAGETKSYTNVLRSFFRLDLGAWGVVLVRGDDVSVPPVIVSRTYNAAKAEELGTFGLSVPAMSVAAGVRPQSAGGGNVLAGLRHDASFRTNLTVANLKDETAEVEVVFRDAAGNALGVPARVTVEARGVKQLNSALSAAPAEPIGGSGFTAPAPHFSAEVRLKRGSGVYPYATVIDAGTGDSIVVTPASRPSPAFRLPGIVRVKGKNGPYWVSDVAVLNPSATERKVKVTYSYVKSGTAGRATLESTMTFRPWEMKVAVDFVRIWLGLSEDDPNGYASSYVDVSPAADDSAPTENLVVAGKTYTPSGLGSVGLQVDPFAYEDGIGAQGSRRRIVLSGLEANLRYRTNIALFLTPGSTGNVQVDVRVLDSFGRLSKRFDAVGLNADTPVVQLNSGDLFAGLTTDDASRATIVIDNPRGTAVVGAYATVIDNKSEDATFVAGQPAP